MEETLSSTNTSTKQQWIAEQAEKHPELGNDPAYSAPRDIV